MSLISQFPICRETPSSSSPDLSPGWCKAIKKSMVRKRITVFSSTQTTTAILICRCQCTNCYWFHTRHNQMPSCSALGVHSIASRSSGTLLFFLNDFWVFCIRWWFSLCIDISPSHNCALPLSPAHACSLIVIHAKKSHKLLKTSQMQATNERLQIRYWFTLQHLEFPS